MAMFAVKARMLYRQRLRPARGAKSPSASAWGWGPTRIEKREQNMRKSSLRVINTAVVSVLALTLSGCSYNKFSTQEEAISAQWAEVQNQLNGATTSSRISWPR